MAERRLDIKNVYKLRNFVRNNGYEFAADFVNALHETFDEIKVLRDVGDIGFMRSVTEEYKLLPKCFNRSNMQVLRNQKNRHF